MLRSSSKFFAPEIFFGRPVLFHGFDIVYVEVVGFDIYVIALGLLDILVFHVNVLVIEIVHLLF